MKHAVAYVIPEPLPLDVTILEEIREGASEKLREQREEVERRILAGADSVEMPYLPGTTDQRSVVYTVPSWRHQPRARLKVAWARLQHRYREHQARWS